MVLPGFGFRTWAGMTADWRSWSTGHVGWIAVLVAFTLSSTEAAGAEKPAAGERPANIQRAIERGVAFLRTCQSPEDGMWHYGSAENHLGATALAGLTFLECDVPANDPQVQKAAELVRKHSVNCTGTYSLSLRIMFLDRLEEEA